MPTEEGFLNYQVNRFQEYPIQSHIWAGRGENTARHQRLRVCRLMKLVLTLLPLQGVEESAFISFVE